MTSDNLSLFFRSFSPPSQCPVRHRRGRVLKLSLCPLGLAQGQGKSQGNGLKWKGMQGPVDCLCLTMRDEGSSCFLPLTLDVLLLLSSQSYSYHLGQLLINFYSLLLQYFTFLISFFPFPIFFLFHLFHISLSSIHCFYLIPFLSLIKPFPYY